MPEWVRIVRLRLAAQGEDPDRHRDVVEEIALHLDDVYRAAKARGLAEDAARAAVDSELNGLGTLLGATLRRRRRPFAGVKATDLLGDLRRGFRVLRARPSASAVIVLTLAVGIGACTTVFSIFSTVLLKSLPFPESDRLVLVWEADKATPTRTTIVAGPVFEDWARMNQTLDAIGIWEYMTFNIAGEGEPEQSLGIRASAGMFDALRVAPALGRIFTRDEDAPKPPRRRAQRRRLAQPARGRSARARQDPAAERPALRGRRRDAADVCFSATRSRRLDSDVVHGPGPGAGLAFLLRRRRGCETR